MVIKMPLRSCLIFIKKKIFLTFFFYKRGQPVLCVTIRDSHPPSTTTTSPHPWILTDVSHTAKISTGPWPRCGQKAHHNAVTPLAASPYKTDTLIQFGTFMLFIDNATPPTHRRPAFRTHLSREWGGWPLLTAPPSWRWRASSNTSPPHPRPHPTPSLQDLSEPLRWSQHARGIWLGAAHQCLFSCRHAGSLWHALGYLPPSPPPPLHNGTYFWFMLAKAGWKQCWV